MAYHPAMSHDTLVERLRVVQAAGRLPSEPVEALGRYVQTASEEQLFRVSPYRYAEETGIPIRTAVDLFLHATRAGIFDFTWGVLCPMCGAFLTTAAALKSLGSKRECTMCQVETWPSDDTVEVAFTVTPAVRRIRFHAPEVLDFRRDWRRVFFSPSRLFPPEVERALEGIDLQSMTLRPGRNEIRATLAPGRYGLFLPAHHAWARMHIHEGGEPHPPDLVLVEGQFLPAQMSLQPGPVTLVLDNRTSQAVAGALVVDRVPPKEDRECQPGMEVQLRRFFTGKELVTTQTFRELFRTESIPSEGGLEFKSLTILFTDLKGSTELYERIGDFRAFSLVRSHFDLLRDIIAARGGSLVKTIGDAVMASFPEPTPALDAAVAMNREIKKVGSGAELQLKIGLHQGPCIAVESNERLDYFGQTVNIAARVQGVARENEVVCTEPVYQAPGAGSLVQGAGLAVRRDRALLKGVDGEVTVFRLTG
jgi:class 3 adenylate cyclase